MNDNEYRTVTVSKVTDINEGWVIKDSEGWSLFVTNENCNVKPKEGETVKMYGKGIGFTVRGVVINDRIYRYNTSQEQKVADQKTLSEIKEKKDRQIADFQATELQRLDSFSIKDNDFWQEVVDNNSKDPYSYACIRYAAKWAYLMEKEIAAGKKVAEVASDTSYKADTEGITGFMFGSARSILCKVWAHGDELNEAEF